MKNNIIIAESDGCLIVGHINIALDGITEVLLLSPYYGLVLREIQHNENTAKGENERVAKRLLLEGFQISSVLQENRSRIQADFPLMLQNLNKFCNQDYSDYQRNRDELLKVLLQPFWQDKADAVWKKHSGAIFNFLVGYIFNYGQKTPLDLSIKLEPTPTPPPFSDLSNNLSEYLQKSREERLHFFAEMILGKTAEKYNWFLTQEFLSSAQSPSNIKQ